MDGRARVAFNLRLLRVARQFSQETLALEAGIHRTYVGGIERQEFSASIDILDRLAAALKVDVSDLLIKPDADATAPPPLKPGRRPE